MEFSSRFVVAPSLLGLTESSETDRAKEASTGVVPLPDDDPQAVKLMIHYLYHLDYPHQSEVHHGLFNSSQDAEFTFDISDVAGATSKAKKKKQSFNFEDTPEIPNLTIHARLYALGEKYDIGGLKTLSLEKFKKEVRVHWDSYDFLRAAEEIYTSTIDRDRGMRDAVVDAISQHRNILNKEQVQNVVKRLDLSFDLLMRFCNSSSSGHRW